MSMDFPLNSSRAAVVAIDLHRGHLDQAVATMPAPPDVAKRVVAANQRFLARCRAAGVPIVHLVTSYRDTKEMRANPFWRKLAEDPKSTRRNALRHNLSGSPGCTIMPGLFEEGDWVIPNKKRYDCFLGTDLDFVLRTHAIDTILLTGVNTNSCVLATAASANVRDYAVIVVEDCVDTMDGPALHEAGLLCIRTAFGQVATSEALSPLLAKEEKIP